MADTSAYIDVIALATVRRTIETYRAKIELSVQTGRKQSCLDESLKLREQVITVLIESGIEAEAIEEAGGQSDYPIWSGSKHARHELQVRHDDMKMLIRGMAAVERLFASFKDPYFFGLKRYFTFHVPAPEFAQDDDAGEQALKTALAKAKVKAAALAQEAGCELGALISITELPRRAARKQNAPADYFGDGNVMFDAITDFPDADFGEPSGGYTTAQPPRGIGRTLFRVRFAVARST